MEIPNTYNKGIDMLLVQWSQNSASSDILLAEYFSEDTVV